MVEQYQSELLKLIEQEFHNYSLISMSSTQDKHEKKAFINGLMTAARVVGVGYDELNAIVQSTVSSGDKERCNDLSIPAYIRLKK